jgi:flagellar hook-associated protein 1 FlgK
MSDLFGSLSSAAWALDAQRTGLDVVGQNIANVNSPGYTRRTLDLSPIPPTSRLSAGNGVAVTSIRAQRDALVERRLRNEVSAQQKQSALADSLGVVELALGKPGESLDADLSAFFDAFATLAESPTSAVSRNEVLSQAQTLAASFRNISAGLDTARQDADTQISGAIDEINNLVEQIRLLNGTISGSIPEMRLTPQDQQAVYVQKLSELVDITVLPRSDGGVDVSVGSGRPLVVGVTGYSIGKTVTAPDGHLELTTGGFTVTNEITGGKLGGLLEARDSIIPGYVTQLDELAYAVAQQVNALHATGYDQAGNAGGEFFSFSTTLGAPPAGAAAAIRLDPAIAADPSLIAAAGTTEQGNNTVARSIAALRDAKVLGGNTATFNDTWGQLIYRVGRDVKNAQTEQGNRDDVVAQLQALRDQVSGVSIDEEAALMLQFQRAYEANARFFRVIDGTLDMLMSLGG